MQIENIVQPIMRGAGSKGSKAKIKEIAGRMCRCTEEVRDPMTSTGAFILNMPKSVIRWANDIDSRPISILKAIQSDPHGFLKRCRKYTPLLKHEMPGSPEFKAGRERLRRYYNMAQSGKIPDEAVAQYLLNRLSHSARTRAAIQYPSAYDRWGIIQDTERFVRASESLQGVRLTTGDYVHLLREPGRNVQVLLDPPYVCNTLLPTKSRFYTHSFEFIDHYLLAKAVEECPHHVLLTYDDHEYVRKLYSKRKFHIFPASWKYSVSSKRNVGNELIITNYPAEMMDAQVIDISPCKPAIPQSEVA